VQSYNTENTNNGRITPEFYESPNYFFNFGNFQAGAPSFPTFYYIPYYQWMRASYRSVCKWLIF